MTVRRPLLAGLTLALVCASVAGPTLAGGLTSRIGSVAPAGPRSVDGPATGEQAAYDGVIVLRPGCHTGYRLIDDERVDSLQSCTDIRIRVGADARRWVPGWGYAFRVREGIWHGRWIAESPRSYAPGKVGDQSFNPGRSVTFAVGRYVGYAFDDAYSKTAGTKPSTMLRTSGAPASAWAVINGRRYVHIAAGVWGGYWIKVDQTGSAERFKARRDNPPLASCVVADKPTAYQSYADYAKTLLDWTYMVPRSYVPPGLRPVTDAGVRTGVYGLTYVREVVIADLRALNSAARGAGFGSLKVNSAYRSYDTQATWFANYTEDAGYQAALRYSNRAGHSGHQLGTTLDIDVYAASGLNGWMTRNAHRHGFVKSYPAGKESKHCYGAEDWHYRYFGRTVAGHIYASGLTEREWLWYARH